MPPTSCSSTPAEPCGREEHAPFTEAEDRVTHIVSLVERCRRTVKAAKGAVHLAVVGVPGIVTADGGIRDDLGPDGGAFRAALSTALDCPVRIENDVNLAALAELTAGEGAVLASFALLLLDDGLGAGIVIDGALHRGFSGVAGEVMYLPQTPIPIGAPSWATRSWATWPSAPAAIPGHLSPIIWRRPSAETLRRYGSCPRSLDASFSWPAAWGWCSIRKHSSSAAKQLIRHSSPRSCGSPASTRRSSPAVPRLLLRSGGSAGRRRQRSGRCARGELFTRILTPTSQAAR